MVGYTIQACSKYVGFALQSDPALSRVDHSLFTDFRSRSCAYSLVSVAGCAESPGADVV